MEPERAKELKRVAPRLLFGLLAVESFTLPIFRSGGCGGLSFWGWVVNHTVFGPPVEYVPFEDYSRELEGTFSWYPVKVSTQTFRTMEEAMAYYKTDKGSVMELVKNGAISIIAGNSKLKRYNDLLADVRRDGKYHSIRSLVQPNDPEVRDVARVLVQAPDFISAAQEFVNSFTTYSTEIGDYWSYPSESLTNRAGDCDCLSILLCSILRNYMPPENVYCAFGLWTIGGKASGHMWVITEGEGGDDRILEATAGPGKSTKGKYVIHCIFNDEYAFATDIGLKEFDLKPVEMAELIVRR